MTAIAQSTIDSAIYLICFAPERLKPWLAENPDGDVIEKIARKQIADNRARRAKGAT